MTTCEPVRLREVRRARLLDELAGLALVGGVNVQRLLEDSMGKRLTAPVTVRLREAALEEAERLAERLADSMEARAAGGKWGRATVLRWAVEVGLERLAELDEERGEP